MITLYTTPSFWGLPSISPACMRLETWLRMVKLPYQKVTEINLVQSPKGKIPYIDYQGKLIGDSSLIMEMFKEKEGIDLDRGLTAKERAISLAFCRMLQENTYWGLCHIRYNVEENWQVYREVLASMISPNAPTAEWEPQLEQLREKILTQMYCQGMGRHSNEEIFQILRADFQALSDFLDDKPFFLRERPMTLDVTAYTFIGNLIEPSLPHPIVDYVLQLDNLCQHYERMRKIFFSDTELNF